MNVVSRKHGPIVKTLQSIISFILLSGRKNKNPSIFYLTDARGYLWSSKKKKNLQDKKK